MSIFAIAKERRNKAALRGHCNHCGKDDAIYVVDGICEGCYVADKIEKAYYVDRNSIEKEIAEIV